LSALVWILTAALRLFGFFFEPGLTAQEIHAIHGEPARIDTPRSGGLTVVTWNIERGVAFDAVAALLEPMDADVVLLQEVDRFCDRSGDRDIARDLAERLRMNWISAGEFQEIGEGRRGLACVTGQAILSRTPLEEASVVVFADQAGAKWRWNPAQPRRGARMALRARTAGVVVYSVHLESGGNPERRSRQMAAITADAGVTSPALVAGDFNATLNESAIFGRLATARFEEVTQDRSGEEARRPIDYVFVRGLRGTVRVIPAAHASDHDPLIARIEAGRVSVTSP
jgi:endonuclease/exonuclease/phosphatase family metal-dependent hydrolase